MTSSTMRGMFCTLRPRSIQALLLLLLLLQEDSQEIITPWTRLAEGTVGVVSGDTVPRLDS